MSDRLTRRQLLVGSGFACAGRSYAFTAGFWNSKEPSAWSPEEAHRLLTHSPWAKRVTAVPHINTVIHDPTPRTGGGPGRGGGGGGRAPAGDSAPITRPRIRDDAGGSEVDLVGPEQQYKGIVRWESAWPVREASKNPLPAEFAGHYVIGLSAFPMGNVVSVSGIPQVSKQDVTRIAAASILGPKGKRAARALMAQQVGDTILLGFSRRSLDFTREDNEVDFFSVVDRMTIKAKFHLKEMMYRDRLAL